MTVVRVAIPLAKGKRRFHIDKGRPWSVVEHAILAAVASKPRAVGELASQSELPRRLVLEILIRLMRAGWVTLEQSDGIIFSASRAGLSVVDLDELPNAPKRIKRWMNFVIDKVTGTLYRSRELPFYENHVLRQRSERERLVWMEPREFQALDEPAALVATLLDEDERFIGLDPAGDRLVDRYALATVRNGLVEGLPDSAPQELAELVLKAASNAPQLPAGTASPSYQPASATPYEQRDLPAPIHAVFQLDDLILGGREHEELFFNALRRAQRRIAIHSTFISEDRFAIVRPLLHDAVKRGVLVDVLWGEDDEKSGSRATNTIVRRIRGELDVAGLDQSLRLHTFSTRSHAKIVIADEGSSGRLFAVVGSCNWLSSSFQSFEASVRLRDPRLVGCVLDQLAELSRGSDGHWTDLTNDLARLASEARRQNVPHGARADMTIVLGPQHATYVRVARDEAAKLLFVTSHRLGAATRPAVIVPAIAAARARGVEARVYYGVPTGSVSVGDAIRLASSAAESGVQIQPVRDPRIHAKLLAWDDDYLLVSSQNWLSADPSDANLRREIGVFIHGTGAGRSVIERFELLKRE